MSHFHVMYLKGDLRRAVRQVNKACNRLGLSTWSLRGDPSLLNIPEDLHAERFALIKGADSESIDDLLQHTIGTIALNRVSAERTRVGILYEDITGERLPGGNESTLIEFCLHFNHIAEASGMTAPLVQSMSAASAVNAAANVYDTGPLVA